jgi:sulfhydrogenase subunit beta (sulfur reductase)
MGMEQYIVTREGLKKLFDGFAGQGKRLIAPVKKNDRVVFEQVMDFSLVSEDHIQTAGSAKEVVFPKTEKLFGYKKEQGQIELKDPDVNAFPETVVWGIRPCDAAGFTPLKAIFNWDYKDKLFNARLDKLVLIGFSCPKFDEFCFCTSVGGGPGSVTGNDILFTRLGTENKYLAEIVTETGKKVVAENAGLFMPDSAATRKEDFLADVPVRFDKSKISEKLNGFFESEIWARQSMTCLGCGACAFVCPTCACFDIQDEAHGKNGARVRCWDSCGFSMFTMHTSGHNPRGQQSQRWRQRLLHKFSYMPERLSVYGCTGCGRCSRACPACMNILEHLVSIGEE